MRTRTDHHQMSLRNFWDVTNVKAQKEQTPDLNTRQTFDPDSTDNFDSSSSIDECSGTIINYTSIFLSLVYHLNRSESIKMSSFSYICIFVDRICTFSSRPNLRSNSRPNSRLIPLIPGFPMPRWPNSLRLKNIPIDTSTRNVESTTLSNWPKRIPKLFTRRTKFVETKIRRRGSQWFGAQRFSTVGVDSSIETEGLWFGTSSNDSNVDKFNIRRCCWWASCPYPTSVEFIDDRFDFCI